MVEYGERLDLSALYVYSPRDRMVFREEISQLRSLNIYEILGPKDLTQIDEAFLRRSRLRKCVPTYE